MICRDCKAFVPSLVVISHGGISQCMPCHQLYKMKELLLNEEHKKKWIEGLRARRNERLNE